MKTRYDIIKKLPINCVKGFTGYGITEGRIQNRTFLANGDGTSAANENNRMRFTVQRYIR